MQKKWLSILLFAPLMQSNYVLADQAAKKELDYKRKIIFYNPVAILMRSANIRILTPK